MIFIKRNVVCYTTLVTYIVVFLAVVCVSRWHVKYAAFMFSFLFFYWWYLASLSEHRIVSTSNDVYYRVAHTIDAEQLINGVCYEARKRNDLRQSDRELLISRKGEEATVS